MPCPEKFKETLIKYNISKEIQDEIECGFEDVKSSSKPIIRGEYFKRATEILTKKIPLNLLKTIYEENGCARTGQRLKNSKEFAKANKDLSLEEKLLKIREVPYMGIPTLNSDGTITLKAVSYFYDDLYHCACPTFNKLKDINVCKNYCYCCGGHFIHHYQIMLDCKIEILEIVSSPLDSNGLNPCVFKMKILN